MSDELGQLVEERCRLRNQNERLNRKNAKLEATLAALVEACEAILRRRRPPGLRYQWKEELAEAVAQAKKGGGDE